MRPDVSQVRSQGDGLFDTNTLWFEAAACRGEDVNLFFVDTGEIPFQALAICSRCPVRGKCLDYAIDNNLTHGVYGGLPPKKRRRLRDSHEELAL